MYALAPECGQHAARRWRPGTRWSRQQLPGRVRAWLLDEGSLTARLVAASNGDFRVRVIAQSWRRPLPDERRALGLGAAGRALVREVALECGGEPWIYARSVLPATTLSGELRHLRRFGARSLGALLFADPRLAREPFEVAVLAPDDPLLPPDLRPGRAVWGRRSVFRLHGRPLLVQEVFLPACRLDASV